MINKDHFMINKDHFMINKDHFMINKDHFMINKDHSFRLHISANERIERSVFFSRHKEMTTITPAPAPTSSPISIRQQLPPLFSNALANGPQYNVSQNIIAGPGPFDYFNHSFGIE